MRLFLLFSIIPTILTAQSSFLKDPDVVWAAEMEQDWVVDIPSLETEGDSGITTLKLLITEQSGLYWPSPYVADLIVQAILGEKLPVFKDPACTIPFEVRQITCTSFETEEEKKTLLLIGDELGYTFIKAWRLRQILIYHCKTATWSITAQAIAPLITEYDKKGDSVGVRPLCWFPPDKKCPKLTSNDIVWAKRTVNKQAKTRVSMTPAHPLKSTTEFDSLRLYLRDIVEKNMKIPLYNASNDKLLSPEDRLSLISPTDTFIYCFSSGPNGENIGIIHYDFLKNLHDLQLIQTWYWDARRQRLSICLDAVAPLVDVLDNEENFRFQRPLFYRRVRK